MFVDLDKLEGFRNTSPYFIYQRITIAGPEAHFIEQLPFGYWFWLRRIHSHYPEQTSVPAWLADLRFEFYQQAANKWPQNIPVPFKLVTTPNNEGVTYTAGAGGGLTATELKIARKIRSIHPFRDNINMKIIPQTGTAPAYVEMLFMGYLIPATDLTMWDSSPGVQVGFD